MNTRPRDVTSADDGRHATSSDLGAIVIQLRRIIVDQLDVRISEEEITEDVPLLERGLGLDSIVLFEFIGLVEKRFGLEFADQALHPDVFANLKVLARHVHEAMQSRKPFEV